MELLLDRTDVSGDITHLRKHTNLRTLDLGHTRVEGRLGPAIERMTRLENLFVYGSNIEDVKLSEISSHTRLRELSLAACDIQGGLQVLLEEEFEPLRPEIQFVLTPSRPSNCCEYNFK